MFTKSHLVALFFALLAALVNAAPQKRDFGPVTIYTPPSTYTNERTLYGRTLTLTVNDNSGTMLTTWENYTPTKPYFPIFRSTDHGFTWNPLSQVQDTVNGWGLRYQPFLYELKQSFGGWAAGTILLAGNSIPSDLSKTQLDLYVSTDKGSTWSFVSHIANGGRAYPNNGETPVWEPFLMIYNNQLVCYYSDQRDTRYGQKIVHQVTSDGRNWAAVVDDVAVSPYSSRPGMPVIAKLGNGQYLMTFEYGGAPEGQFSVYYKITSNPLNFGAAALNVLKTTTGYVPRGSPYVTWTPVGGSSGTIAVTANSDTDVYLNRNNGQGAWTTLQGSGPAAYSRYIGVGFNPKDLILTAGGLLGQGSSNKVTFTARDVNGCATCS